MQHDLNRVENGLAKVPDSRHNPDVAESMSVHMSFRPILMIMKSKGGKSRWIGLQILLVAAAIQGITPNNHNLASVKLFRILSTDAAALNLSGDEAATSTCRGLDQESPPDESAQQIDTFRKKTPGVICLPLRTGSKAGPRRYTGDSLCTWSVFDGLCLSFVKPDQPCPLRLPTIVVQGSDFLHSFCRLTC